ncbi:UNVERIFIED_ORG: hypothetical protein ABIB52_000940 [Arthrobacter sp. UYCu721]
MAASFGRGHHRLACLASVRRDDAARWCRPGCCWRQWPAHYSRFSGTAAGASAANCGDGAVRCRRTVWLRGALPTIGGNVRCGRRVRRPTGWPAGRWDAGRHPRGGHQPLRRPSTMAGMSSTESRSCRSAGRTACAGPGERVLAAQFSRRSIMCACWPVSSRRARDTESNTERYGWEVPPVLQADVVVRADTCKPCHHFTPEARNPARAGSGFRPPHLPRSAGTAWPSGIFRTRRSDPCPYPARPWKALPTTRVGLPVLPKSGTRSRTDYRREST